MYDHPNKTHEFVAATDVQVEVEAAAAICKRIGRTAATGTAASVAIDGVRCPVDVDLVSFGVTITEALTNGNATHCIVALKVLDKEGGTTTTVALLTLPKDSTEVTPSTQTSPSTTTAANAVAAGARLYSADLDIPYRLGGGGIFYVEVTQAAGAAGGAFRPFVVTRNAASHVVQGTTTSPVTEINS